MFFVTGHPKPSPLLLKFGCTFDDQGSVSTGRNETTSVPGLYVAGDASRRVDFAIVAAAEGAMAAVSIKRELLEQEATEMVKAAARMVLSSTACGAISDK
jgi:thioredoxin reductase